MGDIVGSRSSGSGARELCVVVCPRIGGELPGLASPGMFQAHGDTHTDAQDESPAWVRIAWFMAQCCGSLFGRVPYTHTACLCAQEHSFVLWCQHLLGLCKVLGDAGACSKGEVGVGGPT